MRCGTSLPQVLHLKIAPKIVYFPATKRISTPRRFLRFKLSKCSEKSSRVRRNARNHSNPLRCDTRLAGVLHLKTPPILSCFPATQKPTLEINFHPLKATIGRMAPEKVFTLRLTRFLVLFSFLFATIFDHAHAISRLLTTQHNSCTNRIPHSSSIWHHSATSYLIGTYRTQRKSHPTRKWIKTVEGRGQMVHCCLELLRPLAS